MWARPKQTGFTIVELLIVIVVIGILAAIVIVAYSGITQQAQVSALKEDISGSAKILANDYVTTGAYPATLAAANSGNGINSTSGVSWSYTPYPATSSYCLAGTHNGVVYSVTSINTIITAGDCNSLVGWWTLDNNTNDVSGNGYNATAVGPVLTTGQNGQANSAYAFSGASPQYLNTASPFSLNRFTVSIWAYPNGTGPSSFATLISNSRDCCSTNSGFQIDYNLTSDMIYARLWAGGTGPAATPSYNGITLNAWNFIVMTYDGTTVSLYKNGTLVNSAAYSTASLGTPLYNVGIGRMGYTSSGYTFGGTLDDARIYNRALSATEIQTLYAAGAQ